MKKLVRKVKPLTRPVWLTRGEELAGCSGADFKGLRQVLAYSGRKTGSLFYSASYCRRIVSLIHAMILMRPGILIMQDNAPSQAVTAIKEEIKNSAIWTIE